MNSFSDHSNKPSHVLCMCSCECVGVHSNQDVMLQYPQLKKNIYTQRLIGAHDLHPILYLSEINTFT